MHTLPPQRIPASSHQGPLPVRSCRLFYILASANSSDEKQIGIGCLKPRTQQPWHAGSQDPFETQEDKSMTTKRDRK